MLCLVILNWALNCTVSALHCEMYLYIIKLNYNSVLLQRTAMFRFVILGSLYWNIMQMRDWLDEWMNKWMNEFQIVNLFGCLTNGDLLFFCWETNENLATNSNRWRRRLIRDCKSDVRAVATSNIVPPVHAMRTEACCCRAGYYGWTRPRTKLREDPRNTPSRLRDNRC